MNMTIGDALAASVRDNVARMRDADTMIRDGRGVEGVHAMRTSARRLRSAVRYLGGHLPRALASDLKQGLKDLMSVLGPVRDHDVLIGAIAQMTAMSAVDAGALAESVRKRREHPALRMMAWLGGEDHRSLLQGLEAAAAMPASQLVAAAGPVRIAKAVSEAVATRPAWETASDESMHDARKGVKRLRYALEAFRPCYGRPVVRMIEACRHLQESLGAVQDAAMFADRLRGLRTFAAGQFVATVRGAAEQARAGVPDAWRRALGPKMLGRLGAHLLRRAVREPEPVAVEAAVKAG